MHGVDESCVSRWYYKGPHDGVLNWTAMPKIFPPGGNRGPPS